MAIKETLQIWNPKLHQECLEVSDFSAMRNIVWDMMDTMRDGNLIGIAAPQIGYWYRIFAVEIRATENRKDWVVSNLEIFINPKITHISDEKVEMFEGCGSVVYAQFFAPVIRAEKVSIEAYDLDWNKFNLDADWLRARVILHEYDHLEWIEFVEKISDYKRCMEVGEYRKLSK